MLSNGYGAINIRHYPKRTFFGSVEEVKQVESGAILANVDFNTFKMACLATQGGAGWNVNSIGVTGTLLIFRSDSGFVSQAGTLGAFDVLGDLTATATTPLPAALPLFATELGALGLLGWRRKRKAATAA